MYKALQTTTDYIESRRQRLANATLKFLVNMNDYHIAAAFMLLLLVGSASEPNNTLFRAIQTYFPVLTPLWWNLTFAICGLVMALNRPGPHENTLAILFFVVPVTIFFGILVMLTWGSSANSARPTPYFTIMLTIACVFVINMFVARTRVINYLRQVVTSLTTTLDTLTNTCEAQTIIINRLKEELEVKNVGGEASDT